jgi:hypothetical protein
MVRWAKPLDGREMRISLDISRQCIAGMFLHEDGRPCTSRAKPSSQPIHLLWLAVKLDICLGSLTRFNLGHFTQRTAHASPLAYRKGLPTTPTHYCGPTLLGGDERYCETTVTSHAVQIPSLLFLQRQRPFSSRLLVWFLPVGAAATKLPLLRRRN